MTTQEDSHNCLALITAIPSFTLNALVLRTAHDVCYIYLKSYSECLGLAVQIDDLEPCLRREVFARVGTIVDQCKNESGIHPDENVTGPTGLSLGNSFGPSDKQRGVMLSTSSLSASSSRRQRVGAAEVQTERRRWVRLFRSGRKERERNSIDDDDVVDDDDDDVKVNIFSSSNNNTTAQQQRRSSDSRLFRRTSGVSRQPSGNEEMVDSHVSFSSDHEGVGAGRSF